VGAVISQSLLQTQIQRRVFFDNKGDAFYQSISALHKSVRGSDADASLYWMLRMLEGGCDPAYVIRRLIRIASEDIGNADPRALQICLQASQAYDRLGMPEGELALAQAVLYLAVAPKSNAVYIAYKSAKALVKSSPSYAVPNHLCNAVTKEDRKQKKGQGYQYPHDFPDAFIPGVEYMPPELVGTEFYNPVDRGLEQQIAAKLRRLRGS
jgi:putative ATPase